MIRAWLLTSLLWVVGLLALYPWKFALILAPGPIPFLGVVLGRRSPTWAALVTPAYLFLALNLPTLSGWWTRDDPSVLSALKRHGIWGHFYEPEVWREISGTFLSPWYVLSSGLDLKMFALQPMGFYAHQILSYGIVLLLTGLVYRRAMGWVGISCSLTLIAVSSASFELTHYLDTRHYVEGTSFCLGSLLLFQKGIDSKKNRAVWLSALLYLLAASCKEVFLTLPLVLVSLPTLRIKQRILSLIPFALTGLAYLLWRGWMLGWENVLVGYVARPPSASGGTTLDWPIYIVWLLLVVPAIILVLGTSSQRWHLAAGVGLAVTLPLLPVLKSLAARHEFLPWLIIGALLGALYEEAGSRASPTLVAVAVILVWLLGLYGLNRSKARVNYEHSSRLYEAEGRFILNSSQQGVLLSRITHFSYLTVLSRLRDDGPDFVSKVGLAPTLPDGPYWRYQDGEIVKTEKPELQREERELSLRMSYDSKTSRVDWSAGPYPDSDGLYQIMLVSNLDPLEVSPPQAILSIGSTVWHHNSSTAWVLTFRSQEGWVTYSPVLELDPIKGGLAWSR